MPAVGGPCQARGVPERPEVPQVWIDRLRELCSALPEAHEEAAWVGVRWRVGPSTIGHLFGGEDGLFRITFRAEPGEVMAFTHLGPPYFRASWGPNVVGMIIDETTDWDELGEMLTDSYCLQAPKHLADQVERPD